MLNNLFQGRASPGGRSGHYSVGTVETKNSRAFLFCRPHDFPPATMEKYPEGRMRRGSIRWHRRVRDAPRGTVTESEERSGKRPWLQVAGGGTLVV